MACSIRGTMSVENFVDKAQDLSNAALKDTNGALEATLYPAGASYGFIHFKAPTFVIQIVIEKNMAHAGGFAAEMGIRILTVQQL